MAGLSRMGRWVLALAVIATAPLAGWGGGCSSSLNSVQPDASGHAGATGAAGAAGTSATAGTSGAAGDGGESGSGGSGGGAAGCSGADAGCCPRCCQGGSEAYCSADGQQYVSCLMTLTTGLPPGCSDFCNGGTYTFVWHAQSCPNGCTGRGPPPDGGAGSSGSGTGGAPPTCR